MKLILGGNRKNGRGVVDLDDTSLDFTSPFLAFYNPRNGTSFSKRDRKRYNLQEIFNCTQEHTTREVSEFYKTHEFRSLPTIEGAQRGIETLARKFSLTVLTTRPSYTNDATRFSINNHFSGRFDLGIYFAKNMFLGSNSEYDKEGYCKEHEIDLMIDDCLEDAIKSARNGTKVFLIDQPWNQSSSLPKNITRVGVNANPWEEIEESL